MRLRASTSLVLIAGLGPLAGCFSSTSASPSDDAETPEMEASPGTEASVPAEAAAPGMEASVMDVTAPMEAEVEASLPEAAVEAAVEAGPPPIKVTIVNHLGPEPGVAIVLQDSSGNVVTTAVTGITGSVTLPLGNATQVTALMGSGASVAQEEVGSAPITVDGVTVDAGDAGVVAVPVPNDTQIVTVQGVEPGDTLSLADPSDVTFSQATVVIDSVPEAGLPAATNYFQVQIGNCYGNGTPPIDVPLTSDCVSGAGQFPVFLSAIGGEDAGSATLAYAWQTAPAFTVSPDGGTTTVDVTGTWSTENPNVAAFTAEGVLGESNVYAAYSLIADGVEFPQTGYLDGTQSSYLESFPGYPGYASVVQSELSTESYQDDWVAISAIATRSAFALDAGPTIDLSTALPLISSFAYDAGAPTDDAGNAAGPGQPYVAWGTDAGSLAGASGVVVQIQWNAQYCDNNAAAYWTIVAPPTATSVTAPSLPAPYAGWAPNAASNFCNVPVVAIVQSDAVPTYTVFRNQFATFPATNTFVSGNGSPPYVPALPANGTLKLTGVTQNTD